MESRWLMTAGALDTTFGAGGFASVHPGDSGGAATADAMAIQSDGKILQVGEATDPTTHNTDIAIVRYTTSGTLDPTFGVGGEVLTPITTGVHSPIADQVLIDSQGRIVVAGGDGTNIELARYTPSGQLDNSFGAGGLVSTPISGTLASGQATRAAFDASGGIIVAGSAYSSARGYFAPVLRYESNGELDPTFGFGGMAVANFPNGQSFSTINSLLVETDGSIVIGGNDSAIPTELLLLRLTSVGLPDPTFGVSGAVATSIGAKNQETAESLAEQADGKILVAATASSSAAGGFDLARYNPDGTLDTTFGSGGTLNTQFPNGAHANALDVIIDSQGRIIVGGATTGGQFALARYLADGTLDSTFGSGGLSVTANAGESASGGSNVAMALDPSGNIVLGSSGSFFNVARFVGSPASPTVASLYSSDQSVTASANSASTLTFEVQLSSASAAPVTVAFATADGTAQAGINYTGTSGTLTFAPNQTSRTITVQVPANTTAAPNRSFVLDLSSPSGAPLLNDQYSGVIISNLPPAPAAGTPDYTFGWAGYAETHPGALADSDTAAAIAVQPDGKTVEAGAVTDANGKVAFGLARYNIDGSLDPSFGTGGLVDTVVTTGSQSLVNAVMVQPDGKILVVGGDGVDLVAMRYLSNGALDTTFGTGGIATIAPPVSLAGALGGVWTGQRVALDSNGRIVIAASGYGSANFTAALRLTTAGALDSSFGTAGVTQLAFGANSMTTVGGLLIESDPGGANDQDIVVSGGLGSTSTSWVVGRLTAGGAIDTTFGTGGAVTTSFGTGYAGETAYGIAEQANGLLVAAGSGSGSGFNLARYSANGTLDTTFGTAGQVTTTLPGATASSALDLAILSGGQIVVAGTAGSGTSEALALVQYQSGGGLDSGFGAGGITVMPAGGVSGTDVALAVAPDGKLMLGSTGAVVPGANSKISDFNVARFNEDISPGLSIAPASAASPYASGSMTFTVTLAAAASSNVTVQYTTEDNTATAGTDYSATSGTLTFAPGQTTQTISVPLPGYLYVQPDKSFFVSLSNPVGAVLTTDAALGRIQNAHPFTWENPVLPADVNGSGAVTPVDAITLINYLNTNGSVTLGAVPVGKHNFLDPNGSGSITPVDAIIVINYLNSHAKPGAVPASVAASFSPTAGSAVAGFLAVADSAVSATAGLAGSTPAPTILSASAQSSLAAGLNYPTALVAPAAGFASPAAAPAQSTPTPAPSVSGQVSAGALSTSGQLTSGQPAATLAADSFAYDPKTDVEDLLDLLV